MSLLKNTTLAALMVLGAALPGATQEASLTISVGFGPGDEVPDPRAGYNGWMSNQTGVTETLMGVDYDLNLYPRLAAEVQQADETTWRVTLREGVTFHDGAPLTADAVVEAISAISNEAL